MKVRKKQGAVVHTAANAHGEPWTCLTPYTSLHYALSSIPLAADIFDVYSKRAGLEGMILLEAHGVEHSKHAWRYMDGSATRVVQNWIDRNDGLAALLFLFTCNCFDHEIESGSSLVMHARQRFTEEDLRAGIPWRLYIPGSGYADLKTRERLLDSLLQEEV